MVRIGGVVSVAVRVRVTVSVTYYEGDSDRRVKRMISGQVQG